MKTKYTKNFYKELKSGSYDSAKEILPYILEKVNPCTIADFGCGIGTWLAAAKEIDGKIEILGLDGAYVKAEQLLIEKNLFQSCDLSKEVCLSQKFDFAISMEVAEHIKQEYADTFVNNICNAAPVILFSAALPYQGGVDHFNEQPLSYWRKMFLEHGYIMLDVLRARFWYNEKIETFYKSNMVIFVEKNLVKEYETKFFCEDMLVDVVHPDMLKERVVLERDCLISRDNIVYHHPYLYAVLKRINLIRKSLIKR